GAPGAAAGRAGLGGLPDSDHRDRPGAPRPAGARGSSASRGAKRHTRLGRGGGGFAAVRTRVKLRERHRTWYNLLCRVGGDNIGESSNGRTADSGSASWGSNPCSPATMNRPAPRRSGVFVAGEGGLGPGRDRVVKRDRPVAPSGRFSRVEDREGAVESPQCRSVSTEAPTVQTWSTSPAGCWRSTSVASTDRSCCLTPGSTGEP